jgi:hypothetical protein
MDPGMPDKAGNNHHKLFYLNGRFFWGVLPLAPLPGALTLPPESTIIPDLTAYSALDSL